MNAPLYCRGMFRDLSAIGSDPKPWNHMVPRGEFPGTVEIPAGYDVPGFGIVAEDMSVEGVTVLGDAQLESIVQKFRGEMLIDADHLSHDITQSTEAMGWGTAIRYMADRSMGLEVETPWTPPGREKIVTQVYRYISPEFAGNVKYENGIFKFYPFALTGAGLTNRPKLKALKPVSANRETNSNKPPTMKAALTLLCGLIGAPETATEQELATKVEAFRGEIATSKNRAQKADELELEIKGLRDEAINSDLERFADVIEDKESAKALLQMNREAAVKLFTANQAKAAGSGEGKAVYQKNRATAPDGSKFKKDADDEEQKEIARNGLVATVRNREKCDFKTAWDIAKAEKPELF